MYARFNNGMVDILVDMGLLTSKNQHVKCFLCVIDVFTRYALVKSLTDKKSKAVQNKVQNKVDKSSKIGQNKKSSISTFAWYLTAIAKGALRFYSNSSEKSLKI